MVAPALLHYGIPHGCAIDPCSYMCSGFNGYVLPSALCGGSPLVVEVVCKLCQCRTLPLHLFSLVLEFQVGFGRNLACDGLPYIHVNDLDRFRIDVRNSWILILLLVHKKDLWGCQG